WKTCTCPTGNNASTAPAGWWTRSTTLRFPPSKRQRRATEGEAASAPRRGVLPLLRRQVGAAAVGHFRRHAQALAERRVRMDGLADVDGVGPHLDGQRDLADHVAGVRAHDAAAQDLAV